ncbi:MAG: hypothetical protein AB7G15_17010, partial [Alphaproteobacteria bacterium]
MYFAASDVGAVRGAHMKVVGISRIGRRCHWRHYGDTDICVRDLTNGVRNLAKFGQGRSEEARSIGPDVCSATQDRRAAAKRCANVGSMLSPGWEIGMSAIAADPTRANANGRAPEANGPRQAGLL